MRRRRRRQKAETRPLGRVQSQPSQGTSPANNHRHRSEVQPSSDGFPEGFVDQPFYGWVARGVYASARFNGLQIHTPTQPSAGKACERVTGDYKSQGNIQKLLRLKGVLLAQPYTPWNSVRGIQVTYKGISAKINVTHVKHASANENCKQLAPPSASREQRRRDY
jgi:hypothetical protein